MIKPMKLKGIVQKEVDGSLTFHGNLHDKSDFSIKVTEHDVQLNAPFKEAKPNSKARVEGWLYIKQIAKQFDRVSITLPHPSLQHGHHVLVSELELMPIDATIADFRPQMGSTKDLAKE